jgi:hypothetical protein
MPSHYVRTPRGYIFAYGHWDYSLERRGVLFAPVYFPVSVYGRSAFTYSPSIVVDIGLLRVDLFAYPRYSHYYFGDYYDHAYLSTGIYPWFDSHRLHTWYDPIYEHDRWCNQRSEPRWEERRRDEYNRRRTVRDLRPARTYRDQEHRLAKLPEPQRRTFQVAQPITVAVARRGTPLTFERIDTDAREKISTRSTAVRTFRDERKRWESTSSGPGATQPPRGGMTVPAETKQAVVSAARREPVFAPRREANVRQPERVQIPVPPVVVGSGVAGIFRRGPPARPADEATDKEGRDIRRNRAGDRDTRKAGKGRHGD